MLGKAFDHVGVSRGQDDSSGIRDALPEPVGSLVGRAHPLRPPTWEQVAHKHAVVIPEQAAGKIDGLELDGGECGIYGGERQSAEAKGQQK